MPMVIIDNKKVDLTQDEYDMYTKIVKSYTTISNRGEDLFIDLFESDENGIIIFLKPPSRRQTSFEVFLFLMSIFQNQHLRLIYKEVDSVCSQMKDKMNELEEKLSQLNK